MNKAYQVFTEAAGMSPQAVLSRILGWAFGWALKVAIAVLVMRFMGVDI